MYEDVKGVAHGADKARLASWVSDSSEPGYTLRPYPTQPLFAYVLWFAITSFAVTKNKTIFEAMLKQTGKDIISINQMTTLSSYAKNTALYTMYLIFLSWCTMKNINCISEH